MSAIKLSFTVVLLIVAANGQVNPPPTRSPQKFWTLFAQLLTADALKFLANADIFPNPADMMPPAVPANPNPPAAPQPSTTTIFIRGRPFTIPPASDKDAADLANALANINAPADASSNSVAPSQPSAASAPFDPISEIWNVFLELYGSPQVKPMPMPQQPSQWPIIVGPQPQSPQKPTPAPCSTTPAPCSNCEPEKVRIVIVDDCNEKKSSESCSEESDEVDIIVPRERSRHRY
ncbi:hypothetical protein PVAND_004774 [Polypedilum vanderplanki]|uniref:Uncharacterized protein n=1 Tax=Polypedilum vanderplanki TaxID=319348 RepID=A0A9J6BY69_POLVA|nr:hypothetical protein PVAND_004774 [Polypedilum vanderplanki]